MASQKSNKYLDADDSEDDQSQGYDSDAGELRKGGRSAKRRKLDDDESSADEALDQDEEGTATELLNGDEPEEERLKADGEATESLTPRPLRTKNLIATEEAIRKSGVVYISRIPPFMKPRKIRTLLERYGKLNRIYLAEEDTAARKKRLKSGGNRRRMYREGWIEFVSKKEAKRVCDLLNGRTIGGKKRSYYYDSMWTLLYLKGFKWHNLTEQIAAENAARESRMRAEISKAQRENRDFVLNVQKAKMLETMAAKADARKFQGKKTLLDEDQDDGEPEKKTEGRPPKREKTTMSFKQTRTVGRDGKVDAEQPEQVARVLGSIF